jgi:hypothetical protein
MTAAAAQRTFPLGVLQVLQFHHNPSMDPMEVLANIRSVASFLKPAAREHMSTQHVLSPNRLEVARAVAACICLNLPVLLEGPAAVGKTSLVTALAQHLDDIPHHLERVNNTESTGLQVGHCGAGVLAVWLGRGVAHLGLCHHGSTCGTWWEEQSFD